MVPVEKKSKVKPLKHTTTRILKLVLALIVVLIVLVFFLVPAFVSSGKSLHNFNGSSALSGLGFARSDFFRSRLAGKDSLFSSPFYHRFHVNWPI